MAEQQAPKTVADPIEAEVIAHYLLCTAEEMGAALIRTSFSPNVKERADASTAIFDESGKVIAQAHMVPLHLGSMIGAIAAVKERFGSQNIRPGDMYVVNDPYNGGGTHLPDINIVAPVFYKDELVAYVASISHHADVGGMVPGSISAKATSIFQEGLRLPAVRIMQDNEVDQDIFDIILLNSRAPDERSGDLQAQFAANIVGVKGLTALLDRYGVERFREGVRAFLDFTERRFQAAIGTISRGAFSSEDFLAGNEEGDLAPIRLLLTVGDGTLHFDFTGSAPQLRNARNIPHHALLATIYTVAKSMLDPDVPTNAGYYRTISVHVPPGTLVSPIEPTAVGSRSASCGVLGDVIAAALSQAMPERALAGSGPHMSAIFSGTDPRNGSFYINLETLAGGMGARPNHDGIDAVRVHASGSSNLPVEALEIAYPLRVERYSLWDGSGGDGERKGGRGIIRDYRILAEGTEVTLAAARQHQPAGGFMGGAPGAPGIFVLEPDTEAERVLSSAESSLKVPPGTLLRICTPGGGGYGKAGGSPDGRD